MVLAAGAFPSSISMVEAEVAGRRLSVTPACCRVRVHGGLASCQLFLAAEVLGPGGASSWTEQARLPSTC